MVREQAAIHTMLGLCAAILATAALYIASSVFAPVAFSLFIIAIVWPFQRALQARLPKLLANAVAVSATLLIIVAIAAVVAWSIGLIGQWFVQNSGRFQELFGQGTIWLEQHGISVTGFLAERFDVGWAVRLLQDLAGGVGNFMGFALTVLVMTMIGLLDVGDVEHRLQMIGGDRGATIVSIGRETAAKLRTYMLVRTLASLLTGALICAFTLFAGMELAIAWGILAFVLNYIPFLGPFLATILPTLFAIAQFESWQMALFIFAGSTVIQFLIGNYLEPLFFGSVLDISPYVIVFTVFFWAFLWGIPGAFIGVPITIALLTCLQASPSTHWIAKVLSGRRSPGSAA